MATMLPPHWQRWFAQPAAFAPTAEQPSIPPQPVLPRSPASIPWSATARWMYGLPATPLPTPHPHTAAAGSAPPDRPTPPVGLMGTPPEPPRRRREFAWATCLMPARLREDVIVNLRQTLGWRARNCQPLPPPEQPVERSRFGVQGEQLAPQGTKTVRERLRAELRETIRTMETTQPVLVRNSWIAMHSARLGQLCAELDQRGLDALEEVRCGLTWLWE
ncbi:MAG TPA: hypothetical protein VFU32_08915 [Ktedonobacterales bacterium]|nr:hypothetical protein [Ktedonobacterales bacterium]